MIFIPPSLLKQVVDAAEAAYPDECCGLLVGRLEAPGNLLVTRVEPSTNLTEGGAHDSFEVDPRLRLELMRSLRGSGEAIVGLYHSHPDHPALPSARDLERAWEPELAWLITTVVEGQATLTTAHVLDAEGRQFRGAGLATTDWHPYPVRAETGDVAGAGNGDGEETEE